MRDITDKIDDAGNTLPAAQFNANLNSELKNVVSSADITMDADGGPDTGGLNMLAQSISAYANAGASYEDSGAANSYVLSISTNLKTTTKYYDGMKVIFKVGNTNTGASTVNISSLGSKDITTLDGSDLPGDKLIADTYATIVYNLTDDRFEFIDPAQEGITGIYRNVIINGDMRVAQRGTSFAAATNQYVLDRWKYVGTAGIVTVTQDSDMPANHPELQNSLKVDVTTLDASIAAGDYSAIDQRIEGYNLAPFVGKATTLSFWVKSSKTGTYCVGYINDGSDRNYISEYTINVADTWEFKEIPVTFDYSGGTWDYTNGIGLITRFSLACGTDFQAAKDIWNSSNDWATSSQVNFLDSTSNNFFLTGVQLNLGTTALDFQPRSYAEELALCLRYYYENTITFGESITGILNEYFRNSILHPVKMRTTPTLVDESTTTQGAAVTVTTYAPGSNETSANILVKVDGGGGWSSGIITFSADSEL